ncbi:polysaccharide deacetylase family protein [Paenibacillus sp. GCM10012303]|uniref:polysaccharide deacetylase n=1 Tax=Paenibacillus sp. GCM10012303 TaxID=3317340 RepID=UPI0036228DD8
MERRMMADGKHFGWKTVLQWMGLLLAVSLLALPLLEVRASAEDSAPSDSEKALYNRLKAGQRQAAEREYATPERPTVYLTFDDGPSAHTPEVLNILQQEQVSATFFVLGESAKARPELVKRIVQDGHAIGNHTYNHVYADLYGSFGTFWDQVRQTDAVLEERAGVSTRLLRAPGGTSMNFDAAYFYVLEQAGYHIFDWNVDSGDSRRKGVPASEIVANSTNVTLRHEMTVLLHDGSGHAETVKALPAIIRYYKEQGYSFASLSPEVKPVQFAVSKPKWNRSGGTFAEYNDWIAAAKERSAVWPVQEEPNARQALAHAEEEAEKSVVLSVAGANATSEQAAPPLTLRIGTSMLSLEGNDYSLQSDRLYVPLRALVESSGGLVEWEADSRKATARYGMYQVVYDLPDRSVTVIAPGKEPRKLVLPGMQLKDNRLIVPLRSAVELLGGEVSDYSFLADSREVTVNMRDGYGLAAAPKHLDLEWRNFIYLADGPKSPKF